ncbi:MAG: hypothetical protein IPK66_01715 [Rhodospirillales bacterium]|nr:hypothetical protein [Rhodospirillales bacterium]
MLKRRRALLTLMLGALITAGCAESHDESWTAANPANQGYHWIGAGPAGNFASAYNFCGSTLGQEDESQSLLGGAGGVAGIPGGPSTIPGYDRSTQTTHSGPSAQRQFSGCMASQGWARIEGAMPVAAEPPVPPK